MSVLGSYAYPGPTSQHSIDDGPPVSFTPTISTTDELYDQVFFNSGQLTDGEHKITLKLVSGDWFWFDEIT